MTYDHHLSPRLAIVFSLQPSGPNSPMPHSSIFLVSPSNTSRSSLYISHSPVARIFLWHKGHICASTSSPSPLLVYFGVPLSSSFWQVQAKGEGVKRGGQGRGGGSRTDAAAGEEINCRSCRTRSPVLLRRIDNWNFLCYILLPRNLHSVVVLFACVFVFS